MTVALQFTQLYGTHPLTAAAAAGGTAGGASAAATADGPVCCLLRIGPATILLDCGWDENFDLELLEPLLKVTPQLDLVLLSQPDLQHLGALPYLVGKGGLTAPVYAAAPIAKLGCIFYHDCYTSKHAVSDFTLLSPEDIDSGFEVIRPLKHHQLLEVELQGLRFSVVGYPSGHMIGGTIWVVESGGEVVVYGPATNHTRERHLRGGELSKVPVRPALLVSGTGSSSSSSGGGVKGAAAAAAGGGGAGAAGAAGVAPKKRDQRDSNLLAALRQVFAQGGNVLLPVDSSGRLLELLLVLDHMWTQNRFVYHLGLLSHVADSAVRAAAGCIEWMSDEIQRDFNNSTQNPLACRHVVRCHNLADVSQLGEGSKVVVATGLSLENGLSRQLLAKWGADSRNAVFFTQPPPRGSLGETLLRAAAAAGGVGVGVGVGVGRPIKLSLVMGKRVPLQGAELQEYEAKLAEAEAEAEAAAAAAGGGGAAAAAAGGSSQDAAAAAVGLLPLRESSGAIRQLTTRNAALDQAASDAAMEEAEELCLVEEGVLMEGFAPPSAATYCMFPDEQELLLQQWDAYGAVIDSSNLRQDEAELEMMMGGLPGDELEGEDEGPTKVETTQVELSFSAQTSLLQGFTGLSDPSSLATILATIAPRSLLLLGGGASSSQELAALISSKLSAEQTSVVQPAPGQEVTLRLADSYRIVISQQLLDRLSRHALLGGTCEVAWLDGRLMMMQQQQQEEDASEAAAAAGAGAAGGGAEGGGGGGGNTEGGAAAAPAGGQQQQPQSSEQKRARKVHWSEQQQLLTLVPPAAAAGAAAAADGLDDTQQSMDLDSLVTAVTDEAAAAAVVATTAAAAESQQQQQQGSDAAGAVSASSAAAAAAAAAAQSVGDHGGIFIGTVQLSDLYKKLAQAGIPSVFRDGRLLVRGGLVVVSRGAGGEGRLLVEGPLCEDYFIVRDVVYGLYNIC